MSPKHPHYKWFLIGLLCSAAGLNYADRTAITAVFPLLRVDLGMSDVALGATGTAFMWTYALCSPFAGYFGDRLSRARLVQVLEAADIDLGGLSLRYRPGDHEGARFVDLAIVTRDGGFLQ